MAGVIEMATLLWKGQFDGGQLNFGMNNAQKQVEGLQGKFGGLSNFMSKTVLGGVLGLSGGLAAMGAAGIKSALDLQSQMRQFQADTGMSAQETNKVKDAVKNMFVATGKSYSDLTQMATTMHNQLGMNASDIEKYGTGWVKFAKVTKQSNDEAISGIAGIRNAWHLSNDQIQPVLDKLIVSNQKYGLSVTESEGALKSLAPAFQAAHMSINQGVAYLDLFKKAGLDSSSATIAFNTALRKVKSPEELQTIITKMQNTKDDSERAKIAMEIFGKQGLTMSAALKPGSTSLAEIQKSLENATGATDKASKALANGNITVMLAKLKRTSQDLLESVGEKALPTIQNLVSFISGNMPKIQSAMSTAFSVGGKAISLFGDGVKLALDHSKLLMPVIAGLATSMAALKIAGTIKNLYSAWTKETLLHTIAEKGLGAALKANPIGAVITVIGLAVTAGVALYENWDKLKAKFTEITSHFNILGKKNIENIDLCKGKVSEATSKSINSFENLNKNVSEKLLTLHATSATITKQSADSIEGNFSKMTKQIQDGLEKHKNEELNSLKDLYAKRGLMTSTEYASAVTKLNKKYADEEKATNDGNKRIQDIMNTASQQHRTLTQSEYTEINNIKDNMEKQGIQALTKNQSEQKVIFENLKQEHSNISAEESANVVKKSNETKDKVIADANKQYEDTVAAIIKQRDETKTISADQASKMIAKAKEQKDETVKHAQEQHSKIVSEAKKQAGEHIDQVDWETGQVKSKWQVMKDDLFKKMNNIGKDAKDGWEDIKKAVPKKVEEMKAEIAQKWEDIKNKAHSKWVEIGDKIFSPIKKAKQDIKGAIDDIFGFFANLHLPEIKIPHIKLPHFSIQGSFSIDPPSVPHLGVDWYAKGGIFNQPSIIGVGEAGSEAVVPIDKLNDIIYNAMSKISNKNELSDNKPIEHITTYDIHIDKVETPNVDDFVSQMRAYARLNK